MKIYCVTVEFRVVYHKHDGFSRAEKKFTRVVEFYVPGLSVPDAYANSQPYVNDFVEHLKKVVRNVYTARYAHIKFEEFLSYDILNP